MDSRVLSYLLNISVVQQRPNLFEGEHIASCPFLHNEGFTAASPICKDLFTHRLDGPMGARRDIMNKVTIHKVRESYGYDFYVYKGKRLVRVCPSIGMAREVAAGAKDDSHGY